MTPDHHWSEEDKELFQALLMIKTPAQMANFCRDLMTTKEIKEFSKRLQIAKLLETGKMSYKEIAKKTKSSTATVTRVNQWLNHGMNGYKIALKNIKK